MLSALNSANNIIDFDCMHETQYKGYVVINITPVTVVVTLHNIIYICKITFYIVLSVCHNFLHEYS